MEIAPLLAMRGFPLSRSGGEMHWRIPGEESVSIRGNMWYSHYRGKGGDAISFARRFFHMDFKEAVRFLLEQSAAPAAGPVQCKRQGQKQLRLPPKDSSEEQVRRYLTDIRKVSADVAGYFIETGQVYQSRAEVRFVQRGDLWKQTTRQLQMGYTMLTQKTTLLRLYSETRYSALNF